MLKESSSDVNKMIHFRRSYSQCERDGRAWNSPLLALLNKLRTDYKYKKKGIDIVFGLL